MSFRANNSVICCFLLQVLTGVLRKVKMEAVATCVYLHHKSTSTPQSTPVFVLRDRSWQLTVYAAGLVSHGAKLFHLYIFFFFQLFVLVYTHSTHLQIPSCVLQTFKFFFFLYMYNFRMLWLRHREIIEKRGVLNLNSVLPCDPTLASSFPVMFLLFKS